MYLTQDLHRHWVINFFKSKVGEFEFFLHSTIECCDQAMMRFLFAKQSNIHTENQVVYAFSAFSNTIQTLKDAGSTFLTERIVWSEIEELRHGKFMQLGRNAATHDGNPIVSACVEGRYYVPNEIHRFSAKGELIKIPVPTIHVAQFCLEFAQDFCFFLIKKLEALTPVDGARLVKEDIDHFLRSTIAPDFVRQLVIEHRAEIERTLAQAPHDPVEDSITLLMEIGKFCGERLAGYAAEDLQRRALLAAQATLRNE